MTKAEGRSPDSLGRLHVRFGWIQILVFMLLGIVLETMHGFKVGWYLNAGEETRRMLLTLAHAHGVLLGVLNVVFSSTVQRALGENPRPWRVASPLLLSGSILLPSGFLLGGLVTFGGDPGFGIFLVAPAALLLVIAVAMVVWGVFTDR